METNMNESNDTNDPTREFVDDRGDVNDPTDDTSEQARLISEEIEGQVNLAGDQATKDPEFLDDTTREDSLDTLAEGSWNHSTISRAFDVTGNVANSIMEMGPDASHVLKIKDNTDDLTEWPGIGYASASSIRSTIPKLKTRGITSYGLPIDAADDSSGGSDEWAGAVEQVRERYGDDYSDRIALTNDLMDHGTEEGLDVPQSVGSEAVTQPLIRYQDIPSEDAWTQIMKKVGQREADQIRTLLVSFTSTGEETDDDADNDTIYDEYPTEVISQESLREHFDAAVSNRAANSLSEEYGDIKTLAGAVGGQLESTDGVGPATFEELFGTENPDEDRTVAHANQNDSGEDLDGVESVTEQTVKEGIAGGLDVPDPWVVVDEHEAAEREPSILVEHPDGYVAEMWLRDEDVPSGAGKWDIEYVDPAGTRRDGSGSFHDDPQEALDQLVPHIQEVRAEKRDRAHQRAEQEAVEWPRSIGRYHINETTESDTRAEYTTRYLRGKTPLGLDYGDDALEIRFFDDTRAYHVDDEAFARKKTAIAAAREILKERTRKLNERESKTVEETDLEPHQIPDSGSVLPDGMGGKTGPPSIPPDDTEQYTVDIRFATDGISASVYAVSEAPSQVDLLEEAWYTWAEVDELTSDSESHITFELPVQHSENENDDATA
jgi:hypothetical protein